MNSRCMTHSQHHVVKLLLMAFWEAQSISEVLDHMAYCHPTTLQHLKVANTKPLFLLYRKRTGYILLMHVHSNTITSETGMLQTESHLQLNEAVNAELNATSILAYLR